MKANFVRRRWRLLVAVVPTIAVASFFPAAGAAQTATMATAPAAVATPMAPSAQITVDRGLDINPWSNARITPKSMQAPAPRSTVSAAALRAMKLQAAASTLSKQAAESANSSTPPLNVITNTSGFTGAQQGVAPNGCNCYPPDVNAVGNGTGAKSRVMEIVNSDLRVTNPSGVVICETSINTFFNYATTLLFDPRVLYNYRRNVWILEAQGFKETSTGPQYQFWAVSTGSNPCGAYKKYAINVLGIIGTANDWDYPQIGQNQDGLIFTGNDFGPSGYVGACTFQWSIDEMVRGLGMSSFFYCGGVFNSTTTPPEVIDNNPVAHLITVPSSGTTFGHAYWNAPGHELYSQAFAAGAWTVPAYSAPPSAPQPGTSVLLDTSDSRAPNDTAQMGSSLFMAHTVALGGFSSPKWYELDTSANGTTQAAYKFLSATSYDFNAGIHANTSNSVILEWTATDPSNLVNASVVAAGRLSADAANTMGTAVNLFTSPTAQTDNIQNGISRWGDTSSVRFISPFSNVAFIANETVQASGTAWSTVIRRVSIT